MSRVGACTNPDKARCIQGLMTDRIFRQVLQPFQIEPTRVTRISASFNAFDGLRINITAENRFISIPIKEEGLLYSVAAYLTDRTGDMPNFSSIARSAPTTAEALSEPALPAGGAQRPRRPPVPVMPDRIAPPRVRVMPAMPSPPARAAAAPPPARAAAPPPAAAHLQPLYRLAAAQFTHLCAMAQRIQQLSQQVNTQATYQDTLDQFQLQQAAQIGNLQLQNRQLVQVATQHIERQYAAIYGLAQRIQQLSQQNLAQSAAHQQFERQATQLLAVFFLGLHHLNNQVEQLPAQQAQQIQVGVADEVRRQLPVVALALTQRTRDLYQGALNELAALQRRTESQFRAQGRELRLSREANHNLQQQIQRLYALLVLLDQRHNQVSIEQREAFERALRRVQNLEGAQQILGRSNAQLREELAVVKCLLFFMLMRDRQQQNGNFQTADRAEPVPLRRYLAPPALLEPPTDPYAAHIPLSPLFTNLFYRVDQDQDRAQIEEIQNDESVDETSVIRGVVEEDDSDSDEQDLPPPLFVRYNRPTESHSLDRRNPPQRNLFSSIMPILPTNSPILQEPSPSYRITPWRQLLLKQTRRFMPSIQPAPFPTTVPPLRGETATHIRTDRLTQPIWMDGSRFFSQSNLNRPFNPFRYRDQTNTRGLSLRMQRPIQRDRLPARQVLRGPKCMIM